MKRYCHLIFTALFFQFNIGFLFAQELQFSDVNRAIIKHYGSEKLISISEENPEVFEVIQFYFKSSFDVEMIDCESCDVDENEFFNNDLFDTYEHETKRLDDEEYSFEYKDKYLVTLYSENDISDDMDEFSAEELITFKVIRPLPEWGDTGNDDEDFVNYRIQLRQWSLDFPEVFKELFLTDDVLKVSKETFFSASSARRDDILNHSGGYLILD